MDLTTYTKKFHLKQIEFFSSTHRTFSRLDHMLGHKTSLKIFKEIEIVASIFYNHVEMKLGMNSKRKTGKSTNLWKLGSTLLNNQWIKEEITRKLESILRQMIMKIQHTKLRGCNTNTTKRFTSKTLRSL